MWNQTDFGEVGAFPLFTILLNLTVGNEPALPGLGGPLVEIDCEVGKISLYYPLGVLALWVSLVHVGSFHFVGLGNGRFRSGQRAKTTVGFI